MKSFMSRKNFVVIAIFLVLLLGGGAFGLYTWKMNSASFRGIRIDIKGQTEETAKSWEKQFQEAAVREDVLKWVLDKGSYAERMEVEEGEAFDNLKNRVKVTYKERVGAIDIGLTGKRKEDDKLSELSSILGAAIRNVVAQQDPSFAAFTESKAGQ